MKSRKSFQYDFKFVVYREGKDWIAHCLELDLVTDGASLLHSIRTLVELTAEYVGDAIKRGDTVNIWRSAPPEIWKLYWDSNPIGSKVSSPFSRLDIRTPKAA